MLGRSGRSFGTQRNETVTRPARHGPTFARMTSHSPALAAPVGSKYNYGMKTAVSIPDAVYRAGELLAKRLKLPRSRLYALALADYVERHADDDITQRLNASLAAHPAMPDPLMRDAAVRTLERSEW